MMTRDNDTATLSSLSDFDAAAFAQADELGLSSRMAALADQFSLRQAAADVIAAYTNATFATRREAIEGYIAAAETLANTNLLTALIAAHNDKVKRLPA